MTTFAPLCYDRSRTGSRWRPLVVGVAALLSLGASAARGGSATWQGDSGNGDWNTVGNWSPATVPNAAVDVARFGGSSSTSISLSADTQVDSVVFQPGAAQYNISAGAHAFDLEGAGVVNNSAVTQTFTAASQRYGFFFRNSSSAGTGTFNVNGGVMQFLESSTAGQATITITSGEVDFYSGSTGGAAKVVINGGTFFDINANGKLALGSLEGSGGNIYFYAQGAQTTQILTVGSLGTSTTYAGRFGEAPGAVATLVKVGAGTLTLTGDAAYTGGTTISDGVLRIGDGGTSGTLQGNVTNNAILDFARSDAYVFSGQITGTGSLIKESTGTLTLTGENTYSGGTTISGGALQIGNGGTAGSITGNIVDNASLVIYLSKTLLLDGAITGSGSVIQSGPGTTILTGQNTYSGGTTISGGALQLGNGGATGSITGDITNNSSLIFAHSTAFTYGGVITGVGSVTQSGTGTTVLTGDSSYGGGTTISTGALQLGNGGATGSITGNVTDQGALLFDHSDTYVFSGQITGSGGIAQIGTGTTILTADNRLGSGTTIGSGALQLGAGGAIGSIEGFVQDNGALIFDRSDIFTFAGLIQGSGSVSQIGAGATILANLNLYSGGTSLLGGSLGVGADGALGAGRLTVGRGTHGLFAAGQNVALNNPITLNGTLLVIDDPAGAHDLTLTGPISGAGGLTKLGRAVLTLTGTSRYQGATIVEAGSLVMDGAVTTPSTLVEPGALLGGTGRLIGNLFNAGVVSPGHSPGTFSLQGDYRQNAGGALRIEIAGLAPGQHDLLQVTGHASLDGSLQLIRRNGFAFAPGDRVTFLTAGGGVGGKFSEVSDPFAQDSLIAARVVYESTQVSVEGVQVPFSSLPGKTQNQREVARALDSAVGDPRLAGLVDRLDHERLAQVYRDLDLISPDELTSIFQIAVSLANVQTANLERRMADLREGRGGFSATGFALGGTPYRSGELSAPAVAELGGNAKDGKDQPGFFSAREERWGFFITGSGEFTDVTRTGNAAGYHLVTGGVTLGLDYRIGEHFALGATAGYTDTGDDPSGGGHLRVAGARAGLYATAFSHGFHFDATVTGGRNDYDTSRRGVGGSARGETSGAEVTATMHSGYDWQLGRLTLGPLADFQYTYLQLDRFTERGSLAPLRFGANEADSVRTSLGAKASWSFQTGRLIWRPEARAAWLHEFGSRTYSLDSGFANGAGATFSAFGPQVGRDSLLLSAGVNLQWSERVSTYLAYDGNLARQNYSAHSISGGVRIEF